MSEGQWAAVRMPVWRQQLAGYYDTLTAQLDTYPPLRADLETSMVATGTIEDPRDLPPYLAGMREQWKACELYWIAGPMMRVALDASSDMPAFAPAAIVPAPFGFMVFAEALPAIPWADADEALDVPVDGVQWATYGGRVHVRVQHRVSRLPPGRLGPTVAALPFFGSRELHLAAGALADLDALPGQQWRGLWAAVAATWVLMEQPTVAAQRSVTGAGSSVREWQRVPRTVRIIDLRTIEHRATGPGESGRVYTHRWLVRGHWRQQAVGAGRVERRLTWVPSYIKGPEGAPLLHQEHVSVWRR